MRKTKGRTWFAASVLVLALLCFSTTVSATVVNPGDTVFPDVLTGAAGTMLASSVQTFSTPTYDAKLAAAVFRIAAGTLDFYYQITNLPTTTTGQIARTTDFSFMGFTTDAKFRLDGGSIPGGIFVDGTKAPMTADRNAPGDVVGFSFNPPDNNKVLKGESSKVLVIRTNATLFTTGTTSLIDGGTKDVSTFAPTAIPEPASLLLMSGGLLALGYIRRLRK